MLAAVTALRSIADLPPEGPAEDPELFADLRRALDGVADCASRGLAPFPQSFAEMRRRGVATQRLSRLSRHYCRRRYVTGWSDGAQMPLAEWRRRSRQRHPHAGSENSSPTQQRGLSRAADAARRRPRRRLRPRNVRKRQHSRRSIAPRPWRTSRPAPPASMLRCSARLAALSFHAALATREPAKAERPDTQDQRRVSAGRRICSNMKSRFPKKRPQRRPPVT